MKPDISRAALIGGMMLAVLAVSPHARAGSSGDAREAVEMFAEACLANIGDPRGIEDYASDRLADISDNPVAASFLNSISPSAGGSVWGRRHSRDTSVIVSGADGTCAVIAARADSKTLFREAEKEAARLARRLDGELEPTPALERGVARSVTYKIRNSKRLGRTARLHVMYNPGTNYDATLELRLDP